MQAVDIHSFAETIPRFATRRDARRHLAAVAARHSIAHLTYFGVSIPQIGVERDYLISTYSSDWLRRYRQMSYQHIDPVVTQGLRAAVRFDWGDREHGIRSIEDLFDDARSYGVTDQGVSIPIRGPRGERALMSVNTDLSPRAWADFRTELFAHLMAFSYGFHARIVELELARMSVTPPQLSPREIEVLKWASRGKSAWETGRILGLSERTIQFYCRNAALKLNASNTTHAVSIAVRQDLLI